MAMYYDDPVYGTVEIDKPVILDLLNSPCMLRLKKVDQAGFLKHFRPDEDKITRFEHSVGVFLLLKLFGASLEEQIAGLLHDVSHTAFSHCSDYLGSHDDQKKQTHQDDVFKAFVSASEIPAILTRHKIDLDYILNDAHFPLKETTLPDICADRIDYSLRTAIAAHACHDEEIQFLLQSLATDGTIWFFTSVNAALRYASLFSFLNKNHFAGLSSAVMLHTVGTVLRYSIDRGYLTHEMLYTTDDQVLETISQYALKDPKLQRYLDRMYNKATYTNDPEHYHARVFCKSRVVDPLCHHEGTVDRLSFFHTDWKNHLKDEMLPKSYSIRFSDF